MHRVWRALASDFGSVTILDPSGRPHGLRARVDEDAQVTAIVHRGKIYPGQHRAIVDASLWETVQKRRSASRKVRSSGTNAKAPSLLTGLLVDSAGHRMTPTHTVKSGRRYRYYVSTTLMTGSKQNTPTGERLPAADVEAVVLERLGQLLGNEDRISQELSPFELDAGSLKEAMVSAAALSSRWADLPPNEIRDLARSVIEHVALGQGGLTIEMNRSKLLSALTRTSPAAVATRVVASSLERFSIAAEARLRRAGKGLRFVAGGAVAGRADAALIQLIAKAFDTRHLLLSGSDDSLEAMTRRLKVTRGHLNSLIRLSYLAPEIVRAILDGRQPAELTAKGVLRAAKYSPVLWVEQRRVLGFIQQSNDPSRQTRFVSPTQSRPAA